APSNLNRDDTGSPKSADFGGYRRARISSQCLKRAIRDQFKAALPKGTAYPHGDVAGRSKRLREIAARFIADSGHDPEESAQVFDAAMGGLGILSEVRGEGESAETLTEVLIYADEGQLRKFAEVCHQEFDPIREAYQKVWAKAKNKKPAKEAAKKALSEPLKKRLADALNGARSADLALFGRMLADLPERNIDAASQVAHALSTHEVGIREFDYYTAVDDNKPEDNAGADMIGQVEFNSACYYRYANIDLKQLLANLGGDVELARKTVEAFLLANRDAEPTGKQNSFAARNKPSFVFAVVRDSGFWSLANAFARPVRDEDLVGGSVERLGKHWHDLVAMYDAPAGLTTAWCALGDAGEGLLPGRVRSHRELVDTVLAAVRFEGA
ncbi:MAG: type I-E CRISPR-associated protein Cas7/Cse4/CasC, partial [Dehalococcoidia bacterium]